MTGCASSMPQSSIAQSALIGAPTPATSAVSICSPPTDRAVDAEPHVAPVGERHRAAEAGPEAAGHRRLHRQLAGDPALRAHRPHRLQHRRRPAGVDGGAAGGVALEQHREQVGDVAAVAGVAVLAGQPHLAAGEEVLEPARVLRGRGSRAGSGSGRRGRRARRAGSPAARPRCRRRRGSPRRRRARARAGRENGRPSGPVDPDPLARAPGRRGGRCPGRRASTRKSSRTPPSAGSAAATEKARGRNGRSSPAPQPLGGASM